MCTGKTFCEDVIYSLTKMGGKKEGRVEVLITNSTDYYQVNKPDPLLADLMISPTDQDL